MRRWFRRRHPEPVDLYDPDSLSDSEFGILQLRLSDLEGRLVTLEEIAGITDANPYQGRLF